MSARDGRWGILAVVALVLAGVAQARAGTAQDRSDTLETQVAVRGEMARSVGGTLQPSLGAGVQPPPETKRLLEATTAQAGSAGQGQAQSNNSTRPQGNVQESKPEKARGGTADPNVKSDKATNQPGGTQRAAPPQKGGEKSRQLTCDVHVDNRTPYYIEVFVDGDAEGMMGPWGDLYTYAIAGPTVLYARATFTDGTVLRWGPVRVSCPAGTEYTWRIGQ